MNGKQRMALMFEGISVDQHHVLWTRLSAAECAERLKTMLGSAPNSFVSAFLRLNLDRVIIGKVTEAAFGIRQATSYQATSYVWATGTFVRDGNQTRIDLTLRLDPPMGN